MIIRNIGDANIFDAGKYYRGVGAPPAFKQRIRVDGEIREVRLPPMPFIKMVDKVGSVRNITLSNGPVSHAGADETPYAMGKIKGLEGHGFIHYNVCAIADGHSRKHLPESMEGLTDFCSPKDFGDDPRLFKYGNHAACPHTEQVIALRHGDNKKANEIREEQAKHFNVKQQELTEQRNNLVFEELVALRKAATGGQQTGDLLQQIAGNPDMMAMLNELAEHQAKAANAMPPTPDLTSDDIPPVPEDDEQPDDEDDE